MIEAVLALAIGVLIGLSEARTSAIPLAAMICTTIYFVRNSYIFGDIGAWFSSAPRPSSQVSRSFLLSYISLVLIAACACVATAYGLTRLLIMAFKINT